jgi:hypothetical protein
MGALGKLLRSIEGNRVAFTCPGCGSGHVLSVDVNASPHWTFNWDLEKPTFAPSILTNGTQFTEKGWQEYRDWEKSGYPDRKGQLFDSEATVCHAFVTAGYIEFLTDSTHHLSGRTVPLPEFD